MEAFLIIFVCLLFNAVLAAVEMSFVSVSKAQLKNLVRNGNRTAQILLKLRENPERTLSIMQIGITLVGAVSAAVGGIGAELRLAPYFQVRYGLSMHVSEALALISVVLPITFLSVVLGELVPKTLAMRNPLRIALFGTAFLVSLDNILSPLVTVLENSTRLVLKLFKNTSKVADEPSENQVDLEHLSQAHQQYVLNLYHIEKLRIRDILLPWNRVNRVSLSQSTSEVAALVVSSGHTRLPACDAQQDVVGILHTKEFMAYLATGADNWQSLIRPVLRIREDDSILRALRFMQEKRSHLSLVYSKEGVLVGIVTLEDIIEEVVGDIFDEDDDGAIKRILAGAAAVRARVPRIKP